MPTIKKPTIKKPTIKKPTIKKSATKKPATETEVLANLIHAKHACLLQLRDMARRQIELIDIGDMTALLDVLAVKQRSLSQLQRIEQAMDPFRDQDPDRREWSSPDARRRCGEELQQCETLLGEIVAQEKLGESALTRRRDAAAEQLKGAHFSGLARGAYGGASRGQGSQLDLRSDA